MKAKKLIIALFALLLLLPAVKGYNNTSGSTSFADAQFPKTSKEIAVCLIFSAASLFEEGLVPSLFRLFENISCTTNFRYIPLVAQHLSCSLTEKQKASYFEFVQPRTYHGSLALYISIRTLII